MKRKRIDSRFLEPACGEGAFLAPILLRKLATVRRQYGSSPADYEFRAVLALMSIYGVELLADNVRSCRERLLTLWLTEYERRLKRPALRGMPENRPLYPGTQYS